MALSQDEVEQRLTEYVLKNGNELGFTQLFWRRCEPLPEDIDQYSKFVHALELSSRGLSQQEVSRTVGASQSTVWTWLNFVHRPKLVHFLQAYLALGEPRKGNSWLTLEHTHGHAVPIGRFIQVPNSVSCWWDVEEVLQQLVPLGEPSQAFSRAYLFGFLVGIMIGDAHKPKQGRGHRHIDLTMSMKYLTNVKIGEFTTHCANQLGLRMERCEDIPRPQNKPHGFYRWTSQSSPLVDWIFNVCIGLKDGQHTTYDEIAMDWAIASPWDFRLGLIQGIAESDGSVSVASQTVEFWVIPDYEFLIKLLGTFDLKGFRNREAVSLVKSQAIASFHVPVFAEHLRTARYQRLELMACTRKLQRKERIPIEVRENIKALAVEGVSVPKIVEEIARTRGILLSFEAAQRWARKSGACTGRSSDVTHDDSEAEKY